MWVMPFPHYTTVKVVRLLYCSGYTNSSLAITSQKVVRCKQSGNGVSPTTRPFGTTGLRNNVPSWIVTCESTQETMRTSWNGSLSLRKSTSNKNKRYGLSPRWLVRKNHVKRKRNWKVLRYCRGMGAAAKTLLHSAQSTTTQPSVMLLFFWAFFLARWIEVSWAEVKSPTFFCQLVCSHWL